MPQASAANLQRTPGERRNSHASSKAAGDKNANGTNVGSKSTSSSRPGAVAVRAGPAQKAKEKAGAERRQETGLKDYVRVWGLYAIQKLEGHRTDTYTTATRRLHRQGRLRGCLQSLELEQWRDGGYQADQDGRLTEE